MHYGVSFGNIVPWLEEFDQLFETFIDDIDWYHIKRDEIHSLFRYVSLPFLGKGGSHNQSFLNVGHEDEVIFYLA